MGKERKSPNLIGHNQFVQTKSLRIEARIGRLFGKFPVPQNLMCAFLLT
jgi:hypothetical protein